MFPIQWSVSFIMISKPVSVHLPRHQAQYIALKWSSDSSVITSHISANHQHTLTTCPPVSPPSTESAKTPLITSTIPALHSSTLTTPWQYYRRTTKPVLYLASPLAGPVRSRLLLTSWLWTVSLPDSAHHDRDQALASQLYNATADADALVSALPRVPLSIYIPRLINTHQYASLTQGRGGGVGVAGT